RFSAGAPGAVQPTRWLSLRKAGDNSAVSVLGSSEPTRRGRRRGRVSLWKQRRRKVHPGEIYPFQIRFAQDGHAHIRAGKLRAPYVSGAKIRITQIRATEVRVAQITAEKLHAAGLRFT